MSYIPRYSSIHVNQEKSLLSYIAHYTTVDWNTKQSLSAVNC